MSKHDCHHCCLSRRQCLQFLSASALGAGMLLPARDALATDDTAPSDFIDPKDLRPQPKVRVAATFLELPRPYWLGWPGTTYELDKHQKDYAAQLTRSASQLDVSVDLESNAINSKEGVAGTPLLTVQTTRSSVTSP